MAPRGGHTKKLPHGGRGRGRLRLVGRPCIGGNGPPADTQEHDTTEAEPTIPVQQRNTGQVNNVGQPPQPSPQCTPPSPHTPSAEVVANQSMDVAHQRVSNVAENQDTVDNASVQDGLNSANTAASEVAEDNPVRGTGSFRPNVCTVSPDRKRLCPTGAVSRAITDTFHRMWFEEGHSWKTLLPNQVEFYWQEFKFQWTEPDIVVRATWVIHASTRYTDNLSKYRLKYEKTGVIEIHIKQEIWDEWLKKWDTPKYKVKRQKMSSNQRSEKVGPGSGMSRHSCGTKSMLDRHITTGNPSNTKPDLHKIFLETHTKKGKPSEFIDERSRQFEERFQQIYGKKVIELGEDVDAHDCMLQSYVEAAKGFDSHSRLYSVGSLGKSVKDSEQLFVGGEMNVSHDDPEAAATISTLKAKVEQMESEKASMKSKLTMLETRDVERMSTQQELQSQISQLTALVQRFIPDSNGGEGCSGGLD